MNAIEKKRAYERRRATEGRMKGESATDSREARESTALEHQLIEVERTFTDRWEW